MLETEIRYPTLKIENCYSYGLTCTCTKLSQAQSSDSASHHMYALMHYSKIPIHVTGYKNTLILHTLETTLMKGKHTNVS